MGLDTTISTPNKAFPMVTVPMADSTFSTNASSVSHRDSSEMPRTSFSVCASFSFFAA